MEVGRGQEKENQANIHQISMQEVYGNGEKSSHKKAALTEHMQYSDRERIHACWLSRVDGIGAVTAAKLYESCGSFEGIYEQVLYNRKKQDPCIFPYLGESVKRGLEEAVSLLKQREEEYFRLMEQGVRFILSGEAAYPKRLMHIYDKPMWLFVRGTLPEDTKPSAAIIGARSSTPYGRQEAEYFGRILAENGVQVVSGMALGIDQAGHKGALDGGGQTYAVMGCGIDTCYPPSGVRLHTRIQGQGGVLSEYGPGVPPTASHFPIRNRIISGLADLVLVVEARRRSGSLITADLALEQGREVFALPGRRIDPLSEGCNRLIAQGAGIVTKPEDVLDFFYIKCKNSCKNTQKSVNALAKSEKMVYSCLDSQPKHLEAVMKSCGLTAGECMTALLNLEMQGFILQPMNQYYVRKIV